MICDRGKGLAVLMIFEGLINFFFLRRKISFKLASNTCSSVICVCVFWGFIAEIVYSNYFKFQKKSPKVSAADITKDCTFDENAIRFAICTPKCTIY